MTRESGVRWPRIVQPARPAFCISPMRRVRRERTAAKADAGAEASSPNARRAVERRRARKRGCRRATASPKRRKEARTELVKVRLTPEERAELKAMAGR